MGLGHSPRIITENLVLLLDAANPRNFDLTKVEVLVVAGGGGGGWDVGGGGGAGGVCYSISYPITPGSAISVTIGNGGAGANANTGAGRAGSGGRAGANGDNSVFGAITAFGGGGGGGWSNVSGANGGSGGGQTPNSSDAAYSATQTGGEYYVGYGNPGGISARPPNQTNQNNHSGGSGGGGSGGPGGGGINDGTWTLNSSLAGFGGPGLLFNISGTTKYYGGGGGSSSDNSIYSGIGGIGGGGGAEQSGEANTGGGGGSGGLPTNIGGTGGSGIIIVRYQGPQKAIGGVVTSVGGDTIHTFTTSGNFTPLVNTNNSAVLGLSDLSGNRNFGKSEGGVLYSSANGGSLVFEGSDEYVDFGSDKLFKTTGGWTVSSWINLSQVNYGNLYNFIGASVIDYHSWYWTVYQQKLALWNVSPGAWYFGNTTIQSDTWYNAVLVSSDSGTQMTAYLNGVNDGGTLGSYSWNASYSGLKIGYIGRGDSGNGRYFYGKYPIFSAYNRALTAAEISQNFNALKSRYI